MRVAIAAAFATLLIAGSPAAGDLRSVLSSRFPASFTLIVAAIIGAAVLIGFAVAAVRIRSRPAAEAGRSWLAVGAAILLAVVLSGALRTGDGNVDAVETFHFVEYGFATLLFYASGTIEATCRRLLCRSSRA